MKLKFCGAAREVTGSAHLITLDDGYTILLDCGMYQGNSDSMKDFNEHWLFDPAQLDCVVLSHAHIDHSGRLPKLVKDGFKGQIYSTPATRSLCAIMLLDSALIQERDAEYANKHHRRNREERVPLYREADVKEAMTRFVTFSYGKKFELRPGVTVEFRDAGHILGSASVALTITEGGKTTRLGFTGDVGRPNRPILRDPQPMDPMDFLLSESTYGDRLHDAAPQEINRLLHIIAETCLKHRGKLIIPAFSIGRTQEIVYILDQLENAGQLPPVPVYVDSPLAVNATLLYGSHPECYDAELSKYILKDPNPFGFARLKYIKEVEDSKRLNFSEEPCIIISASGMANAGRVKHHLFNNIENSRNTVLIVGYASPDTPAGRLRDHAKTLRLFGEEKQVRCHVEIMDSFSAHADRDELSGFLSNQRPSAKRLFLVHGDYEVQQNFKSLLLKQGFHRVEIPKLGEEVELG
jgi:metallo-beta-lactamase family protein